MLKQQGKQPTDMYVYKVWKVNQNTYVGHANN